MDSIGSASKIKSLKEIHSKTGKLQISAAAQKITRREKENTYRGSHTMGSVYVSALEKKLKTEILGNPKVLWSTCIEQRKTKRKYYFSE